MAKKIISCLIALTLVLGMAALNVSADTKLTIKASNEKVKAGEDVTVSFSITSSDVSYFAFNVEWDKSLLTYKGNTLKKATSANDTSAKLNSDGYIKYWTLRDGNADEVFDDTVFLEITFTATRDIGEASLIQTPINVVLWSDEGYCDKNFDPMPVANVLDIDGSVTIYSAPYITDVSAPSSVNCGKDIVVTYNYEDVNDVADNSYAEIYLSGGAGGFGKIGEVLAVDGVLTIPASSDYIGKQIRIEIIPRNADGDIGERVVLEPIFVYDTKLTIKASNETVKVGEDVTVSFSITSSDVSYFAFNVEWDEDLLEYKSFQRKEITSDTVIRIRDGCLEYQSLRDRNSEIIFDDQVILEIAFTATDDLVDLIDADALIDVVVWPDDGQGYCDKNFGDMLSAEVADIDGTVTIKKPHLTPEVTANIDGSGKIGEELVADVVVVDNWGLVPNYTYFWTIDGEEVSDGAYYTPKVTDLNKDITLTVTATVDAEENPSATQTDTIKVIKNDEYKPVVVLGEVAKTVKATANLKISYDYSDGNGISDASYAKVYVSESQHGSYRFKSIVLAENGKIVIPTTTDLSGKFIKVEVVPANVDGDEGKTALSEPVEVIPLVEAEKVTVSENEETYDTEEDCQFIKLVANVDAESEKIEVGSAVLYYSPDKGAFYGTVTTEDVGAEITSENIALAASVSETPAFVFYFGKVNNPTKPRSAEGKVTAQDVAAAKRIVLNKSKPSFAAYLAADVGSAEPDGKITALDVAALKRNGLRGEALPVVSGN